MFMDAQVSSVSCYNILTMYHLLIYYGILLFTWALFLDRKYPKLSLQYVLESSNANTSHDFVDIVKTAISLSSFCLDIAETT